jgi:hypothetical protein
MTTNYKAPGLSAAWLNGWLAAIGVTILTPDTRLHWTRSEQPHAVFDNNDLITQLSAAIPTIDQLDELAIARNPSWAEIDFPRKVPRDSYTSRVARARDGDTTLAATVTDLAHHRNEPITHSPFDPPAPKGLTLHQRLVSCRSAIDDLPARLTATLAGQGERAAMNGLGFDYSRLFAPTIPDGKDRWCEPVIELLCFYALGLLPARGDGHQQLHTRGWTGPPTRRGSFTWPTWHEPLTIAGIDALLDRFWADKHTTTIEAAYRTVPYQPRSSLDATRGFASERLK